MDKRKEHEYLNRFVNEFLSAGGKIQIIKMGQRGKCLPRKDDAPNRMNPTKLTPTGVGIQTPTGNRCKICDWSGTDNRSVCNPEIAEYGHNRLEIDDLTGDMLCRYCLSAVAEMNRPFMVEEDEDYGLSPYFISSESRKEVPLTLEGPNEDDLECIALSGENVLTRQLDNLFDKHN